MKPDLNTVMEDLARYGVRAKSRPDGSVLLTVAHNGKRLKRVVDEHICAEELLRLLKFELISESKDGSISEAAQYSCTNNLPTYSHEPISRTRSANLWEARKIKDL